MKKLLSILFMCFYVVSVSGASFHLHFCGNSLEQISFAGFGHQGCCCGKTMNKKNCCTDKLLSFESLKEHQKDESVAAIVSLPENNPAPVAVYSGSLYSFIPDFVFYGYHAPPDPGEPKEVLIFHSVFRI